MVSFHAMIRWLLLSVAALLIAGCSALPGAGQGKVLQSQVQRIAQPKIAPAEAQSLADGNRDFALDFYRATSGGTQNQFFSPYSLSVALAMTYAGARGETERQMAQTLHLNLPQDQLHPAFNALDQQATQPGSASGGSEKAEPFQLRTANSLWGQADFSFLPSFLDILALNYGAGMRLVDFKANSEAARQEINGWVERQTEQRIKDLIPPGGVNTDTRLALVNAIYFKADWRYPFEPNNTRDAPFTRLDGTITSGPFMSFDDATSLPYLAGEGFQAVELPYVGDKVSMVVVVPDAGTFESFEAGLTGERWQEILEGLNEQEMRLALPKFEFESSYELSKELSQMGMPDAFCDSDVVDFSAMTGQKDLCIGRVFHKAFVAVDEKGTEAAAASAVVMQELSAMMQEVVSLVVDRPFIIAIVDRPSGSLLFMGRLVDPYAR